jgi:hypothetical protein
MGSYKPSFTLQYPLYQPAMRVIAAITNAFPASVTTTIDHQYLTGTIARLNVPDGFGMTQANQLVGTVTVTGATTFLIDIDTTKFDAFVLPSSFPPSYNDAQVVPIGEVAAMISAAVQNVLPY